MTEKQATPTKDAETVIQAYEAGFSTNFYLIHPVAGRQQFTFRGAFSFDWPYVMDNVKEFIESMREKGWKLEGENTAPKPNPDAAAKVAQEAGNSEMVAQFQVQGEAVPDPPTGKEWQTVDVSRVVILPQPDNKCNVEFYADGHKWPDVKVVKWSTESVAGLMKHVTSHDVATPGDFTLSCRVYYTWGNEYTKPDGKKGNYKDVAHVRSVS